jgi:hypothetical protein
MYKILENLATDGLGQPSELSAYVKCEIDFIDDYRIVDVRVLRELDTPSSSEYKLNIMRVARYLELGEKVVGVFVTSKLFKMRHDSQTKYKVNN